MKPKTIKAWALIDSCDGKIVESGSQNAWRHCIFPFRHEASMFRKRSGWADNPNYRIVRVTITVEAK